MHVEAPKCDVPGCENPAVWDLPWVKNAGFEHPRHLPGGLVLFDALRARRTPEETEAIVMGHIQAVRDLVESPW